MLRRASVSCLMLAFLLLSALLEALSKSILGGEGLRAELFEARSLTTLFLSSTQYLLSRDTSPNMSPGAEEGEVSDADEELLCKPVCVWTFQCCILNRSLRHLWPGDLR